MPWHISESTGRGRYANRPLKWQTQRRRYFLVSQWPKLHPILLGLTIKRIARMEIDSVGPVKARLRGKRLRAVRLFETKFGPKPIVHEYRSWHAPTE